VPGLGAKRWGVVLALVSVGLAVFLLAVLLDDVSVGGSKAFARAGYCSVAGNTTATDAPLQPGTFLDLLVGEPSRDGHYTGATLAIFVKGSGLTCGTPPAGYVRRGVTSGLYPYYVPAGG
jgi:hypothetical protein